MSDSRNGPYRVSPDQDYWVRIPHFRLLDLAADRSSARILVPFQMHHAVKIAVPEQRLLTGNGSMDIKLRFPAKDKSPWDYETATRFCEEELSQKALAENKRSLNTTELFLRALERLEGSRLNGLCVAPNGLIAAEVVIPSDLLHHLIQKSKKSVLAYQFLWEMGLQAMNTQSFDFQPAGFRGWFQGAVTGKTSPPNRRPKAWAKSVLHQYLYSLVRTVCAHGYNATRNDVSPEHSACDIVAAGCVRAGIQGVRSYESVRKIHLKYQKLSVGKITF